MQEKIIDIEDYLIFVDSNFFSSLQKVKLKNYSDEEIRFELEIIDFKKNKIT